MRIIVAFICLITAGLQAQTAPQPTVIVVDTAAASRPFPHYWEKVFGSGRAILTLRESYRSDLRTVKEATGFQYARFHNIFHDEVGVYDEDATGNPIYNWSYVDQIYDGLLANGIRPFVELSFMPKKLAAQQVFHAFWYKPIPAPPKDWNKWEEFIYQFGKHLVERYGIDEVSHWYFEVWNEPNLDFWVGEPKQPTYFSLYDHAAQGLKRVDQRILVGGPATAQAAWVDVFIKHCVDNKIPLDFVSTHVYGNDRSEDVFGTHETIPREDMVCRAVKKVHDQVSASAKPALPIHWTEYNASYMNETNVTDAVYMAAWLPHTISDCDGLVNTLSYWTFSDVFEEQGVIKQPFYGGFGILAEGGVPKPAFNAFKLLHTLGDTRINLSSDSALLTRRADGTIVLALWNLVPLDRQGVAKQFTVKLPALKNVKSVRISRVDSDHGNVMHAYENMGSPRSPTKTQWAALQRAGQGTAPESIPVSGRSFSISVPPEGLAVVEIKP